MEAKFVYESIGILRGQTPEEVDNRFDEWVKSQGDNVDSGAHWQLPIPEGYVFNNKGSVRLRYIKKLPKNLVFNNGGGVDLTNILTITEGTKFNNGGFVELENTYIIEDNVEFNNDGFVSTGAEEFGKNVVFNNEGNVYFKRYGGYRPSGVKFTENVVDVMGLDNDNPDKTVPLYDFPH